MRKASAIFINQFLVCTHAVTTFTRTSGLGCHAEIKISRSDPAGFEHQVYNKQQLRPYAIFCS